MRTTPIFLRQIYVVALLFAVVIALFASVYFILSTFETVRIYGRIANGADDTTSNIPIYIYFNDILVGVVQSHKASNSAQHDFAYELNNEFGLSSNFPGAVIGLDFGTIHTDATSTITKDNISIEVRAGNSFSNRAAIQTTGYLNSRNIKSIIGGFISIFITVLAIYFLIRISDSQVFVEDLQEGEKTIPFTEVQQVQLTPKQHANWQRPPFKLTEDQRTKLINTLMTLPSMRDKDSREACLYRSGLGQFTPRLKIDEKTEVFVPLLVKMLDEFGALETGDPAVFPLLRETLKEIGQDGRRTFVEGLIGQK